MSKLSEMTFLELSFVANRSEQCIRAMAAKNNITGFVIGNNQKEHRARRQWVKEVKKEYESLGHEKKQRPASIYDNKGFLSLLTI